MPAAAIRTGTHTRASGERRTSLIKGDIGPRRGEVEGTRIKHPSRAADTSNEGYMDIERPPNLRTPGTEPGSATPPGGAGIGGPAPPSNPLAAPLARLDAATRRAPAA